MPPKIEGPTMIVVTTDEEWAAVHGEDCSEGVKGFLHAALWTRGATGLARCQWLWPRVPRPAGSQRVVGMRHP